MSFIEIEATWKSNLENHLHWLKPLNIKMFCLQLNFATNLPLMVLPSFVAFIMDHPVCLSFSSWVWSNDWFLRNSTFYNPPGRVGGWEDKNIKCWKIFSCKWFQIFISFNSIRVKTMHLKILGHSSNSNLFILVFMRHCNR